MFLEQLEKEAQSLNNKDLLSFAKYAGDARHQMRVYRMCHQKHLKANASIFIKKCRHFSEKGHLPKRYRNVAKDITKDLFTSLNKL